MLLCNANAAGNMGRRRCRSSGRWGGGDADAVASKENNNINVNSVEGDVSVIRRKATGLGV